MPKIIRNKSNVDLDYPICRPSLDLDFTQEVLDERITFTRGSTGTRVNRNRLIETVPANQPRFDYDPVTGECKGLLIEESRQNLLTYSEDFSTGWSGFRQTILTNQTISPDGNITADIIQASQSNVNGSATLQTFTPSTTTYTFSVFAKSATTSILLLRPQNTSVFSQAATAYFDLSNGTLGNVTSDGAVFTNASSTIQKLNNGWYRCSITFTLASSAFTGNARIYVVNSLNSLNVTQGASIYIWGAQLEAAAFPTSYIPTGASTVTRSADNASITGNNFSNWYNQSEGTFYIASRITASPVSPGIRSLEVSDMTSNNRFEIGYWFNVTSGIYIFTTFSRIAQYQTYPSITLPASTKQIASYSTLSNSLSYVTSISSSVNSFNKFRKPNYNVLGIGKASSSNGNYLNGTISRLTYYPRALKPLQLQLLTQ